MKTKSIAILTMGLAMLSMDGMAQTTRQEYKDILDIQLTPGAPRRLLRTFQYLLPQLVCPFPGISH